MGRINYDTHYLCTGCRKAVPHGEAKTRGNGRVYCPNQECRGRALRTRQINNKSKTLVRIDA